MTIAPLDKPLPLSKTGPEPHCRILDRLLRGDGGSDRGAAVLPEFWRRFLTEILIWGLLAMSSDLLIGYTGMVSFGHSAFFGLGMYGAAGALICDQAIQISGSPSCSGLPAPPAPRLFVAYFSTRLRDIYFAITTLIFSQIFYVIIFTWTAVTGGENGLIFTRPHLSIPFLYDARFTSTTMHWFVLAVVTGSYLFLRRVTQSPFGMVLQSIRENEPRTRAIGYSVERYKIVAVMLSGLFAGLAGVLYAVQNEFAAPDFVFFLTSGDTVIYNVIGGIGTLVGPIVGAGLLPARARTAVAAVRRSVPLPDPARHGLHRDDHLPAAGPARLRAAMAEQVAARNQSPDGDFSKKLESAATSFLLVLEVFGEALVEMRGALVELAAPPDRRRRNRRSRAFPRPSDRPSAASATASA